MKKSGGVLTHKIYMASKTVLWSDLGLKVTYDDRTRDLTDYILLERFEDELREWLESCEGHHVWHERGVWFENPHDAVRFKLSWKGRFK